MVSRSRRAWTWMSCAVTLTLAVPAAAVEDKTPGLILFKTKLKTENAFLSLPVLGLPEDLPVPLFTQTPIACPATPGTCTLRVELVMQVCELSAGEAGGAEIRIDGSQQGVQPFPTPFLSANFFFVCASHPFVWMKRGLAPGTHTIDVGGYSTDGSGTAGGRTLTIQMFTP